MQAQLQRRIAVPQAMGLALGGGGRDATRHAAVPGDQSLHTAEARAGEAPALVVLGRNNPSPYTVKGRPLYVHLNGLAIVLLK